MRNVTIPARWRRAVATIAGATALAAACPVAASACTPPASAGSAVFSAFGDQSSYVLAPGGSFESGTSGWTLSSAAVKSGNDTLGLGAGGSHALWVPGGGAAISAPFCVTADEPTFRFVARQASGSWAQMNVDVLWTDASGTQHATTAGGVSPSASWTPTQVYGLGQMLPTESSQSYTVRLRFLPAASGGTVAVDDLYVDPYNRG